MVIKFPCRIFLKPVDNNHQTIKCDKCNLWIHIKCNKINKQTNTYLQTDTSYWYCMLCTKEFLPFSDTSDEELMQTSIGKRIKFTRINNFLKSVKKNFIQEISSETKTSKYFTMSDLQSLTYNKKSALALFDMNINPLQFHFDELETLFVFYRFYFLFFSSSSRDLFCNSLD